MSLFSNAKWLIFGGIGYRLRGFMLGVFVGICVSSYFNFNSGFIEFGKKVLTWFGISI